MAEPERLDSMALVPNRARKNASSTEGTQDLSHSRLISRLMFFEDQRRSRGMMMATAESNSFFPIGHEYFTDVMKVG